MSEGDLNVIVRRGRPGEEGILARLHVVVWRATYRGYATPEAMTVLDETKRLPYWQAALKAKGSDKAVWVATQRDDVLGVISFGPPGHDAFGGRTEVKHLYVAQHAQGRGIGQRLLQKVLDAGKDAEITGVALAVVRQNQAARKFYSRMGGVEIDSFVDPGPLWRSENIVMAWD